jgi:predicted NAD/FAD-binding protein
MFPEKTITDFTNSVNAQSVLRLLQKILKFYRQKTIHLFVDNAAYDKSRLVKEWLKKHKNEYPFAFFTGVSPELKSNRTIVGLFHENDFIR